MSILSKTYFHDEAAAFEHLEAVLWPDGPVCPHCGVIGNAYALKGVRSKPSKKNPEGVVRHGLKKCGACRKQFTVRVGTVFESSHIPLTKWLQAVYLMTCSKKGVSSHHLHRILEITYKAAWFMTHRIREAMRSGELAPMGGAGGIVEVDETFIGNDRTIKPKHSKKGRGYAHKHKVLSLVERNTGQKRSMVVDDLKAKTLVPILRENIARETHVMTDEASQYAHLGAHFTHDFVSHGAGEYGRGEIHTNTIEGAFSVFKRGMKGIYQHCGKQHLHRYLAEFDFRYNNRSALGVEDQDRATSALKGASGKRLTYRHSPSV
jgi:transposase-like protein